ncbi:MAG TPA: PQQ-dependent sugar dehydrogenase [Vicinamibacterales bacterium]|nr:PQQ-dependent sugar dehydrogenase [Vicinamibacterales bacterium]
MTHSPLKTAGLAVALSACLGVYAATVEPLPGAQTPQQTQPPPATPPGAPQPPVGGSAAGQGRGRGQGAPGSATYAQFCASCHGPTLQGGSATSLVDDDWKFGSDDASITAIIREGRPGTAMVAFKEILNEDQIRQLLYYIRTQAALQKGKPETKVDPEGHIVKSEKQTVKFEIVAKDLETPWGIAFLPDKRMLVTERPGRLRIVDKGKVLPAITGTPAVWERQDGGLFDVEVDPNYSRNGWIYLSYSEPLEGFKLPEPDPAAAAAQPGGRGNQPPSIPSMTVIVRGKIRNNAWVDQQVLFRGSTDLYTTANFHYGSRFVFDRQGHLFYSIGDKGKPEDAQDLSKPTGKIHRINADGSIPKDNPFVNREGAVPSIWSYGHRNPQGLAFDPLTNKLWETEHGPTGGDELNLIEPGKNYGWAVVSNGLQPGITKSEAPGMESPKTTWTPTIAPAGIVFYNGNRYPGWKNSLFVCGLGGQQLRRIEIQNDAVVKQEVLFNEFGRVRDIIIGPDGYLYVSLSLPGQRLSDTTAGVIVRMIPQ